MKKILFTFLAVFCILKSDNCFAQWQPDVRLTNNPDLSNTSFAWSITASGNFVHAVWYDFRDGNNEIYYKRSTDGGISWEADTRLTNNSAESWYPSVSVSGQVVHVAWSDRRDGNDEIYYKRSTDGGISWGTDTRLTNNPADSWFPSISVSGSVVHIAWNDNRDGNAEIYYERSTDGGVSWGADTRLSNTPDASASPSISISASSVHVVWCDLRDGNYEIYYKRSTDGGVSWGTDARLTNAPGYSFYPSVSVSSQVVHVVWMDVRDGGGYEIYYKRSTDGGVSWEADIRLTNAPDNSNYPSVSVSGQVIHVAWYDRRDGNYEIYYKRSTDGGVSWGDDTRLTNAINPSVYPSVSVSGQVVHIVWSDLRDGNYEIYYKRDPTGNVVGITNINTEIPNRFFIYQNYPNPFNPNTVISFQLAVNSFATLKIYDVLGREVTSLVSEQLQPGTYEVAFDGTNYPSGIYYYKLTAEDFTVTKRMVLIK